MGRVSMYEDEVSYTLFDELLLTSRYGVFLGRSYRSSGVAEWEKPESMVRCFSEN